MRRLGTASPACRRTETGGANEDIGELIFGFTSALGLVSLYERGKKVGREERPARLLEAPKPVVHNLIQDLDGSVIRILEMKQNPPRRLGDGR